MDAIKNYLESMFMNLPNTPEVLKAKYELGQMMEDKYAELIEEGKTDNEAVGTVIAEFGNLEELSEELGIKDFLKPRANFIARRLLSMNEVKEFISYNRKRAFRIALAILLCILCPLGPIILEAIFIGSPIAGALGATCFFLCIGAAVALFIYTGMQSSKWDYIKKTPCTLDMATVTFIQEQKESYKPNHSLLTTIGVVLCSCCFVPIILIDGFAYYNPFLDEISGAFLFLFVGIGVFLIVLGNMINGTFSALLKLNDVHTVSGSYVAPQHLEPRYSNKVVEELMSLYWFTVTCIYLIWSFLSFDWYITWIIWPIAAIINAVIKATCRKR